MPSPKVQYQNVGQLAERSLKFTNNGSGPVTGEPLKFATGGVVFNVAVTVVSAVMVTAQFPWPEHPPPVQPAKVAHKGVFGVAVRVTVKPPYCSVQSVPQSIPAGSLVTVPVPIPFLTIVNVTVPVPDNGTFRTGVSGSFEVIVRPAVFEAAVLGPKATCIWHVSVGTFVVPEQLSDCFTNSTGLAPARVAEVIERLAVPELAMVMVCGDDVLPICRLPKSRDEGIAEISGFGRVTVFVSRLPELS